MANISCMKNVCSNSHPSTLTRLLVTVGPTEATRTAAVVVCQKVLEMRETVYVAGMYSDTQCYNAAWLLIYRKTGRR